MTLRAACIANENLTGEATADVWVTGKTIRGNEVSDLFAASEKLKG